LRTDPDAVKPVWDRFAARAIGMGFTPLEHDTTQDPAIHLVVDGQALRPLAPDNEKLCFVLPSTARSIRLLSRSFRPAELRPWLNDPRRLGVAIRSIALRDRDGETVLGADHPALTHRLARAGARSKRRIVALEHRRSHAADCRGRPLRGGNPGERDHHLSRPGGQTRQPD
jgi:hypothetical protein